MASISRSILAALLLASAMLPAATPAAVALPALAADRSAYPSDPTLPPDSGVLIDAGRFSTNDRAVEVDVAVYDAGQSVSAMRLSDQSAVDGDGVLASGQTFTYSQSVPWTLVAGPDGLRTVWAQLQTSAGWSVPVSDSIYLDTTRPSGTVLINNGDAVVGDPWNGTLYEQTLTGTATDDLISAGGSITQMAASNDGQHWRVEPYTWGSGPYSTSWMISDNRYGGHAADGGFYPGTKTVYAKWQDDAGNWSPVVTDTIEYVDESSIADMYVDGQSEHDVYSPTFKSAPDVTLSVTVHIPPPNGDYVTKVKLYANPGDGVCKVINWPPGATSISTPWSLIDTSCGYTTNDGVKDLRADIVTKNGYMITVGGIVILDRVVPTADSPLPVFSLDHVVNETAGNGLNGLSTKVTTATTTIAWKASDTSPIAEYDLQRRINMSWSGVTLAQPDATATDQSAATGTSDQYRVQATDVAGNTGAWKKGPAFAMSVIQENATQVTYSSGWKVETRADALAGSVKYTTTKGAWVKMTFTGRAIAWVAPRTTPGDSAAVYVDGKLIKTVALVADTYTPRLVVFSMAWKGSATHTIKIVKKYANGYHLPVDGFLVLK